MTGEQKPGGLEVVALGRALYESFWRRNGGGEPAWCDQASAIRNMWDGIADDAREALTPAEPAEARVRELEARLKLSSETGMDLLARYEAMTDRATAAEAQLARAVEGLERIRDGGTYFAAGDMRDEARHPLAALQEAGEAG